MKYIFKNPSVFIKKKLLNNALQSLHRKCWDVNYSVLAEHVFSAKWNSRFFAVLQIACDIMKSYWVLQHQISQHSECLWLDKGRKKTTMKMKTIWKGSVLFCFPSVNSQWTADTVTASSLILFDFICSCISLTQK